MSNDPPAVRNLQAKIVSLNEISEIIARIKREGKGVVFTNGCFDLLHAGHVRYLQAARALGDVLVVGVNTDASVRRIKGDSRPLVPQEERTEVLAGLECVDFVVLFDDPTPYRLIAAVRPNVLVKGGDWPLEEIVGRDIVEADGGRVLTIPLVEGLSTTALIRRIIDRSRE